MRKTRKTRPNADRTPTQIDGSALLAAVEDLITERDRLLSEESARALLIRTLEEANEQASLALIAKEGTIREFSAELDVVRQMNKTYAEKVDGLNAEVGRLRMKQADSLEQILDRLGEPIADLRTADVAQLRDERDRARATAVALEQENERLLELLAQASTLADAVASEGHNVPPLSDLEAMSEEWQREVDSRLNLPGPRDHALADAFAQTPTLDALLSEEAHA